MFEIVIDPRLFEIDASIEHELEEAVDVIALLLEDRWKDKAISTRSYRTGAYMESINVSRRSWLQGEHNERMWEISAGVPYDWFIEQVYAPVPGFESMDGKRRPAALAVESVDADVIDILDQAIERAVPGTKL